MDYSRRGWPVLPLYSRNKNGVCDCGESDCKFPAKHPRTYHGCKDATTDERIIKRWGREWPTANWGIATGKKSGLLVLDVDGEEGNASISKFQVPYSFYVLSARGWHGYFKLPTDKVYPSLIKVLPGIDVRAENGYAIAPPSIHITGKKYEVYYSGEISIPPSWLVKAISDKTLLNAPSVKQDFFLEGERNEQLFRRGCGFARNSGMNSRRLFAWLWAANLKRCLPPLSGEEVKKITANILKIVRQDR